MPWELRVLRSDGDGSLGSLEHVQAQLRAAVPEIKLFRDASGAEKLEAMASRGIDVPATIREQWLGTQGAFQGVVEGDGFTIEFHLGEDEQSVAAVGVDVRGNGDPMPVLERLMAVPGWNVVDLRGAPPSLASWQSFGTWRDEAIGEIEE